MPLTSSSSISCRTIGVVHSRFKETVGVPVQAAGVPHEVGRLEVFAEFQAGLKDIEGFDYLILLTHLHLCPHEKLEVVPFLDTQPHGIFATRAPARPNRIGISVVRLLSVEGRVLHFSGNDMVDQTPVLDIKPYVPAFDVRQTTRIGWFEGRLDAMPEAVSDHRMS
ncbi:MAG: tsaA [Rhodoferax sp.]|nr:tsaA [Rhodoferax sp.]